MHPAAEPTAEFGSAINAALARLRAVGNPGCTMVDRGRWRRDHPGWALDLRLTDTPDKPVSLLASGHLLLGTRVLLAADLRPHDRTRLMQLLQRLGSGVMR